MTDNILGCEYTIQVTRKGSECVASIPELCIAEKGDTPQEALAAVLQVEAKVRETIEKQGMPLPPVGNPVDPFPGITRLAKRNISFFTKLAIGYVLVVCMTVVLLAIVYPSARSRVEQYLVSQDAATDARKVFSRLGVAVCLENP